MPEDTATKSRELNDASATRGAHARRCGRSTAVAMALFATLAASSCASDSTAGSGGVTPPDAASGGAGGNGTRPDGSASGPSPDALASDEHPPASTPDAPLATDASGAGGASGADAATGQDARSADTAPVNGGACADRKGGALITFGICSPPQTLAVWITNNEFITKALANKGKSAGIPFMKMTDGRDCDPQWSWHVDPASASFVDASAEIYDGCPAYVEQHKAEWLKMGQYGPWSAKVMDVVDRR